MVTTCNMPRYLTFSLPPPTPPQAEHETETYSEMLARVTNASNNGNPHQIIRADQSFVQGTDLGPNNMVSVINAGTTEFEDSNMGEKFDILNLGQLFLTHFPEERRNCPTRRGNIQANFGLAGGQNTAPIENSDLNLKYNGACVPRVLSGTVDQDGALLPWIRQILEIGTGIGSIMGIGYCHDDFLLRSPECLEYFGMIDDLFGNIGNDRPPIRFAGFTLAAFELNSSNRVRRHGDLENDPEHSGSLILSEILKVGERWWRVSLVFYCRKSISDAILRVKAAGETTDACAVYLDRIRDLEPYRLPGCSVPDYFLQGLGSEGCAFTWDRNNKRFINIALRCKATADKQGNFYGPLIGAINGLCAVRGLEFGDDLVEIIAVVGSMCSLYTLCTVLLFMQDCWDRKHSSSLPGGLFQYIVVLLVKFAGSATGGPMPRCMNFVTKDLSVRDVRNNCLFLWTMVNKYRDANPDDLPAHSKEKRRRVSSDIFSMAKKLRYAGALSVQHIKDVLALLGIFPTMYLEYGVISSSVTHNKRSPGNEWMKQYLNDTTCDVPIEDELATSSSKSKGTSAKRSKFSVILSSVARHVRSHQQLPGLTEADAENIACEARRSSTAYDFWTPGAPFFRKECERGGCWTSIRPVLNGNRNVSSGALEDQINFIQEPISPAKFGNLSEQERNGRANGSSVIWDGLLSENDGVLNSQIRISSQDRESEGGYYQGVITRATLETYPGLLDKIKLAMIPDSESATITRHSEYMCRINAIDDLVAIALQMSSPGNRKKRERKRDSTLVDTGASHKKGGLNKVARVDCTIVSRQRMATTAQAIIPSQAVFTRDMVVENQATQTPVSLQKQPVDFSRCSFRVDPSLGINQRLYQTSAQLGGTLMECWLGFSRRDQMPTDPYRMVNQPNLIHSALCSTIESKAKRSDLVRIKISKDRNKRSNGPPNSLYMPAKIGETYYYRLHLSHVSSLMVGVAESCKLHDSIAKFMSGRSVEKDGIRYWYFKTKEDAIRFVSVLSVCAFGSGRLYQTMFNKMRHACQSNDAVKQVLCVRYSSSNDGVATSHYLVGCVNQQTGRPTLAIGMVAKTSNKMMFVRLL